MSDAVASPPEFSLLILFFGLAFLAFLIVSLGCWIWFTIHFKTVRAWPGWGKDQPSSRIGLVDLILFFCCIFVVQIPLVVAVRPFITREAKPVPNVSIASEETTNISAGTESATMPSWVAPILSLSYMMAFGLSVFLLFIRTGATLRQLGILGGERIRNVAVGLATFFLATPVILILSGVVNSVTEVEYEHPVIESMREHPWTFPLLFFGAVICAPLWEEYAFRGLLIRWLDSVRGSRGDLRTVFLGQRASAITTSDTGTELAIVYNSPKENPYLAPSVVDSQAPIRLEESQSRDDSLRPGESPQMHEDSADRKEVFPPWWPAIISGVVFGLAHIAYGASWVPLIVFGIISARLFQLRRSIMPCIVLHGCFNALSMFGLAAKVFAGE